MKREEYKPLMKPKTYKIIVWTLFVTWVTFLIVGWHVLGIIFCILWVFFHPLDPDNPPMPPSPTDKRDTRIGIII